MSGKVLPFQSCAIGRFQGLADCLTHMHILLPLNQQFTFEQSRVLAELLARMMVRELPEISTITRNLAKRDGQVYIDYLQNGTGKLIASSYCIRTPSGCTRLDAHKMGRG